MKMLKKLGFVAFAAAMAFIFFACSNDGDDDITEVNIVAEWEANVEGGVLSFSFYDDATFEYKESIGEKKGEASGTYTSTKSKALAVGDYELDVKKVDGTLTYAKDLKAGDKLTVTISENGLTVEGVDGVEFKDKGADNPSTGGGGGVVTGGDEPGEDDEKPNAVKDDGSIDWNVATITEGVYDGIGTEFDAATGKITIGHIGKMEQNDCLTITVPGLEKHQYIDFTVKNTDNENNVASVKIAVHKNDSDRDFTLGVLLKAENNTAAWEDNEEQRHTYNMPFELAVGETKQVRIRYVAGLRDGSLLEPDLIVIYLDSDKAKESNAARGQIEIKDIKIYGDTYF